MKKLFCFALILLCYGLTSCYKEEIQGLKNRLDVLEGTQVASMSEQIDALYKPGEHYNSCKCDIYR